VNGPFGELSGHYRDDINMRMRTAKALDLRRRSLLFAIARLKGQKAKQLYAIAMKDGATSNGS
jgi:hypothetical protein